MAPDDHHPVALDGGTGPGHRTILRRLWLTDFRNYRSADVSFSDGLTAVVGDNGQGKTNLLEAVAFMASLESFRGAATETLIRHGASQAVLRALVTSGPREILVEAELGPGSRRRIQVNKQRLARIGDMLGLLRVTVFSPDDVSMIKGGPAERRRFLDDTLVAVHPRYHAIRADLDKVVRQRNATLKSAAAGRSGPGAAGDLATTLAVWDAKLVQVGEELARGRLRLVELLEPLVTEAYRQLSGGPASPTLDYSSEWLFPDGGDLGLAAALARCHRDELRRGVTLAGPHRDELAIGLDGMASRTHSSQGEQRTLALALRLAAHRLLTERTGVTPLLLLDDVFSELDPGRSQALVDHVPPGQTVLTTASALPPSVTPERTLTVAGGELVPADGAP